MNPADLAAECVNNINRSTAIGLDATHCIISIVTPKGWKAPPKFPKGQIVNWREDGSRVRILPAMKTLAWLAANFPDQVKVTPRVLTQHDMAKDGR